MYINVFTLGRNKYLHCVSDTECKYFTRAMKRKCVAMTLSLCYKYGLR